MKFKGEEVRSFDFKDEVDSWKKVHSVNFSKNPKEEEEFIVPTEKENNQEIQKKERNMEEKGIRTMYYTRKPITNRRPRADRCFYPHAETGKIPHEE